MSNDMLNDGEFYQDTMAIGGDSSFPETTNDFVEKKNSVVEDKSGLFLDVDISDATSDKDKVMFTIMTKTNLPEYSKPESKVVRNYEEFQWLHEHLADNEEYAAYIIPPTPPKPDFEASRAKLQKLSNSEGLLTKEDIAKLKSELEAEYVSVFRKTVAMHEVFLKRLAGHAKLRSDYNLKVFLEFNEDLNVRTKTTKEKAATFLKSVTKTADEALNASSIKDDDQYFCDEKYYLSSYYTKVKESASTTDAVVKGRNSTKQSMLRAQMTLNNIAMDPPNAHLNKTTNGEFKKELVNTVKLIEELGEFFDEAQKLENMILSDEDLKLVDTVKFYTKDSGAAKQVLCNRTRALINQDVAGKALDRAKQRQREIQKHSEQLEMAKAKFEDISVVARKELDVFKLERVRYFKKNLVDLANNQIKHAQKYKKVVTDMLEKIREVQFDTELIKPKPEQGTADA